MAQDARPQRGYTLIEAITVAAVAGLAVSLAVPGISDVVGDQRRASAINELVAGLHLSRSTAITRNQSVSMCPSDNGNSCTASGWESGWLAFVDPTGALAAPAEGDLVAVGRPAPGVTIRSAEFEQFLAYRANGQVMVNSLSVANGTFAICDGRGAGAARLLVVNAAGKPQLESALANGQPPSCPE